MRIHHIALRTADLARLESFYVNVVGLAVVPAAARAGPGGDRVWLAAGTAVLMLERAGEGEGEGEGDDEGEREGVAPATMDLLAFAGDDAENDAGAVGAKAHASAIETWRARLASAGVRVEAETAHTLYFRDPDGRRVALSTHPLR
jgi:glyoxylase I family protein